MRMIFGSTCRPRAVTVGGCRYQGRVWPLHEVGALLDARAVHPGRSAYHHLHSLAAANGIARQRVDEVLERVGLASVARKRVGGFSLGISQRLGIAGALLGDPGTLIAGPRALGRLDQGGGRRAGVRREEAAPTAARTLVVTSAPGWARARADWPAPARASAQASSTRRGTRAVSVAQDVLAPAGGVASAGGEVPRSGGGCAPRWPRSGGHQVSYRLGGQFAAPRQFRPAHGDLDAAIAGELGALPAGPSLRGSPCTGMAPRSLRAPPRCPSA